MSTLHRTGPPETPARQSGISGRQRAIDELRAGILAAVAHDIVIGALHPVISRRYEFEQAAEAVAAVEAGHATGNIVVTLDNGRTA